VVSLAKRRSNASKSGPGGKDKKRVLLSKKRIFRRWVQGPEKKHPTRVNHKGTDSIRNLDLGDGKEGVFIPKTSISKKKPPRIIKETEKRLHVKKEKKRANEVLDEWTGANSPWLLSRKCKGGGESR